MEAEIQNPYSGGAVTIQSFHYDALMRLRKIKVEDEEGRLYWLVPIILPDGSSGLERREVAPFIET